MIFIEYLKIFLSYITVPVIFFVGIYFTYNLKFLQITYFIKSCKLLLKKNNVSKMSSFGALASVLGGNLGTGNIAGIAVAVSIGGPGALFWMCFMTFFGSIIKFVESYLGVKYQKYNINNDFIGGPMCYFETGLGLKNFSKLYCLFALLGSFLVGNLVQVNSVTVFFNTSKINSMLIGIFMCILISFVIFKKLNFFIFIVTTFVPLMAIIYLVICFFVLFFNYEKIIFSIKLILKFAFSSKSAFVGIYTYTIIDSIRVGFDRGVFATDIGTGLTAILHGQVKVNDSIYRSAFIQGIISIIAPFIVMIICVITGMILIITDSWINYDLESTNMCIHAFTLNFDVNFIEYIIMFIMFLFAFTTILTWFHCARQIVNYIDLSKVKFLKIFFIIIIPFGSIIDVKLIWSISDIVLNIMLLINMIGIVYLRFIVINDIRNNILNKKKI